MLALLNSIDFGIFIKALAVVISGIGAYYLIELLDQRCDRIEKDL